MGFDSALSARRLVLDSILRGDSVDESHGGAANLVASLPRSVAPNILVLGGFRVALGEF